MSDIRFNQWLHQSGTGGVSQVASGAVGVGTTNPLADFYVRGDAQITGILTAGHIAMGSSITFGDDDRAYFGDGTDMQLYHNGTNSYIENGTNALNIKSYQTFLQNANGSEDYLKATDGYGVELYHNNNKRIETTGLGVTVFGTTQTQQLNVSGVTTITGNGSSVLFLESSNPMIRLTDTDNSAYSSIGGESGFLYLYTNSSSRDVIFRGSQEVARITGDGKLGIGTVNPTAPIHLHKASGDAIQKIESSNGASVLELRHTNGYGYINYRQSGAETFRVGQIAQFTSYSVYNPNSSLPYQLCVEGNGEVGINTHNPVNTLHLLRNSTNHGITLQRAGTNAGTASINVTSFGALNLVAANNLVLQSGGSQQIIFNRGSTEVGRFNTSGNLGIGTDNPTNKLSVCNGGIKVFGAATPNINFSPVHGNSGNGDISFDGSDLKIISNSSSANVRIGAYSKLTHFVIKANGRIGMGTDSPSNSSLLHLYSTTFDPYLRIGSGTRDCGITLQPNSAFTAMRSDSANRLFVNAGGDSIRFSIGGTTDANEKLRITSGGLIGINTTSPSNLLHIVHQTAGQDVLKIEGKALAASSSVVSKINFQVTQSNGQSARLAEMVSHGESGWGGQLSLRVKPSNATPENTTMEALRIRSSDSAATNLKMVVDAYLQMGGYENTNESFVNLAVLFSARDMAGSTLVSGQTDTISGYARRRTTSDGNGTFFFGPYGAFPCGDYTALFRMKISDRSGSSTVGYIDIIGNGIETQGRNIAPITSARRIDVQTNDFTESDKYQYFAMDFSKSNSGQHIETRFLNYSSSTADIYLDHVLVLPRINHGFEGGTGVFDY